MTLVLEPQPEIQGEMKGTASRVKFYESSLSTPEKPLLSIATKGPGMRLTYEQTEELYAWLADFLEI